METPVQPSGFETMADSMGDIRRYFDWVFAALGPNLGQRILEIGPGYGRLAERILEDGREYWAIDTDSQVMARLRGRLRLDPGRLITGDITSPQWEEPLRRARIDTVLSMNVLEHIEDDEAQLRKMLPCAPGGRLVLMVPALPALYGRMDQEAGHFRRYTKSGLEALLRRGGLRVRRLHYFNGIGAVTWFVSGRLLRVPLRSTGTNRLIRAYDQLVIPVSRLVDPLLAAFLGQSLIAVADIP